jgi:alkylated DNA repair dioxygenase AlkB
MWNSSWARCGRAAVGQGRLPPMSKLELSLGAWIELLEPWLGVDEAAALQRALTLELRWEQREIVLFGKRILQPRLIAWAGELPYRYSGQTLEPRAWPPALEAQMRPLSERVARAAGSEFNHVLVNRYRDGNDSMGYHADAEPELGPDPVVATLSFGQTRCLSLRAHRPSAAEKTLRLPLSAGSLLVMGGTCQRHYRHAIPKQAAEAVGERISLTFRRVLSAPKSF